MSEHLDLLKSTRENLSHDLPNGVGNQIGWAIDKIESLMAERDALDQALRIRIWNDLRERGVSQDKAIIEIEAKMAATLSHSSPTKDFDRNPIGGSSNG